MATMHALYRTNGVWHTCLVGVVKIGRGQFLVFLGLVESILAVQGSALVFLRILAFLIGLWRG